MSNLKPTKGASRDDIFLADQKILLTELGGQEKFRKFYIDQPDRFFLETDIIVYLIDIQDDARYQESLEYLTSIIRTLKYLQEVPDFIVLYSKSDPDVVKTVFYQEKYDFLTQKVNQIFKTYPQLQYEIQTSSIFNIVSMVPNVSRMIKGIFSSSPLAEEDKIASIGKLLMKVVDLFLDSEANLNKAISSINQRLSRLEKGMVSASAAGGPAADATMKAPTKGPAAKAPGPAKPKPSGPRGGLSQRAALLSELKQVFGMKFGGKKE